MPLEGTVQGTFTWAFAKVGALALGWWLAGGGGGRVPWHRARAQPMIREVFHHGRPPKRLVLRCFHVLRGLNAT